MIKINLLSSQKVKKTRKKIEIQSQLIFAAVVISVIILGCGYVWILLSESVNHLQSDRAKLTAELSILKTKVKEVENYERDKKVVEEKIKVIEQLRRNQSIPVLLLDEVSKSLPERVWLVNLIQQGETIDLDGKALTNSEIVDFINNLKKLGD
jgi:type IV pilus assembly protein PilN